MAHEIWMDVEIFFLLESAAAAASDVILLTLDVDGPFPPPLSPTEKFQ